MILCAKCQTTPAPIHPQYGPMWCKDCNASLQPMNLTKGHEFVSEEIKEGRRKYHKELLQPYRDGEFSKEYRDAYPEQSRKMVQAGVISYQQYAKAKNVWRGDELR